MARDGEARDFVRITEMYNHCIRNTVITFEETEVDLREIAASVDRVLDMSLSWLMRALPREKGRRSRRGPAGWHQKRTGKWFLFFLAHMGQYWIDDVLALNTGHNFDPPAATTADLVRDAENVFKWCVTRR